MCKKVIQHTARDVGKTYKSICTKPDYKDGFCKKHYDSILRKSTNWGDRVEYKSVTQEEMNRGISMKLKNTNQHNIYKFRGGLIKRYCSKSGKYLETDIKPDVNLFCYKTF